MFTIKVCIEIKKGFDETKRYDQKDSLRCWAFSGINVIKRNMANNLNIDIMDFELSDNFISFFHRLEKANTTYERVLTSKITDLDKIVKKSIFKNPVEEVENWQTFFGIVKKYGLVPMKVMPSTFEGKSATKVSLLFWETVISNAISLIESKKKNPDFNELRKIKLKMLTDNYEFLSKVYGEPANTFNYDYIDKNGNCINLKNISPNQFVGKFLTIDMDNFVFISNVPKKNRKYGEKLKNSLSININKMNYVEFLHVSVKELKDLSIKQLKDNIPVMVGIYIKKQDGLLVGDIDLHHWMTITVVQIEAGIPKRWKVEDSYDDKQKVNGYYIMNAIVFYETGAP